MTESRGSEIGRSVSAQELRERRSTPVILTFQPESFFVAESPEQLGAWEKLASSRFNMPARVVEAIRGSVDSGGTCCESGSTNDCDAD